MADESYEDKTEPATPKKIAKAREDGKVLKSQEVTSTVMIGASILVLSIWLPFFIRQMVGLTGTLHAHASEFPLGPDNVHAYFISGVGWAARLLLPVFMSMVVVALVVNAAQVGILFTLKPMMPKFSSLNPIAGIKRLFSAKGAAELVKSLLKVFIVATVGYLTIRARFSDLLSLAGASSAQVLAGVGEVALQLALNVVMMLLVLAVADYIFQRWQHLRSLRMSKKEVQDEYRQSEGDPHIKGKVRAIMRQASRQRMMTEAATADVVVTNPVHVAVALRYEVGRDAAPVVVAKGMRKVALRIKEIAAENGIPVVENPPLARQINRLVEVGDTIPAALYKAVAEVLAFVYRLRGQRTAVGGR